MTPTNLKKMVGNFVLEFLRRYCRSNVKHEKKLGLKKKINSEENGEMDGNGWKWGDSWDFFGAKKTHLRTFLTDPFRFTSQVREPNLETTNSKNHQPPVPGTWDPCFAPTKKNFQTDSKLYFWCKLDYTHENERGSPLKRDYFSKQYIFHRDMLVFRRVPIWKKNMLTKQLKLLDHFTP